MSGADRRESERLADSHGAFSTFLALTLGFAMLLGLSDAAWALLRMFWLSFTVLSLMALLEPLRRGLSKKGGSLPLPVFTGLLMQGVLLGLLLGSVTAALLAG